MKKYDFKKAKNLIENASNLESATLGMHEDWFWTADTVFENGEFVTQLNDDTEIGGINGSSWATPTLQLCFKDGTEENIEVSVGENDKDKPIYFELGVLSKPLQDNRKPID
jgi:hypothetical protein